MTSSLGHLPAQDRWTFDAGVSHVFEDMLARSIPQYDVMRGTVTDLGFEYRTPNSTIVDLGCSRGDALAPFVERYADENQYIGIDVSEPMLDIARRRFDSYPNASIVPCDLRTEFPQIQPGRQISVALCVLTLQFTPIEYRLRILRRCYDALAPGGCLLLVEKILGNTDDLNTAFVSLYHRLKAQNGYTTEEIERKRLSLEGVLVPQTAEANEAMLRRTGFAQVDCFWRYLNFAGWIALR